jgi:hypothetical protein
MESARMALEPETKITVNFPPALYQEIKRISATENWAESDVVVLLTTLGAKSQKRMEMQLHSTYESFLRESDPVRQDQIGDDMLRSIFGPDAIA